MTATAVAPSLTLSSVTLLNASKVGPLNSEGSVFWGPMAMVIMGGLMVATLLTLFFLPALYALCYRVPRGEVAAATEPEERWPAARAMAAE